MNTINIMGVGSFKRLYDNEVVETEYIEFKSIVIEWRFKPLNIKIYLIKVGKNSTIKIKKGNSLVMELSQAKLTAMRAAMATVDPKFQYEMPKDFMEYIYKTYFVH